MGSGWQRNADRFRVYAYLLAGATRNDISAAQDGLTGQTQGRRTVGYILQPLRFRRLHRRQVFHPRFNSHAAGGTGAIAATLVRQLSSRVKRRIEERVAPTRRQRDPV